METVGDRPDVLGDRWICEVQGASGFVQTQNELVMDNVSDIGF